MSAAEVSGAGRDETTLEQMDRNFLELLQELRVVQTGTQILTGFLLTVPFQPRFADLSTYHQGLFLAAISLSFLTTALLVAPVSLHRSVFRKRRRPELVHASHRLARLGLVALALTMIVVLCLIFSVVVGDLAGLVAAGVIAGVFAAFWWVWPWSLRGAPAG